MHPYLNHLFALLRIRRALHMLRDYVMARHLISSRRRIITKSAQQNTKNSKCKMQVNNYNNSKSKLRLMNNWGLQRATRKKGYLWHAECFMPLQVLDFTSCDCSYTYSGAEFYKRISGLTYTIFLTLKVHRYLLLDMFKLTCASKSTIASILLLYIF